VSQFEACAGDMEGMIRENERKLIGRICLCVCVCEWGLFFPKFQRKLKFLKKKN
jgi:hypothetical protein